MIVDGPRSIAVQPMRRGSVWQMIRFCLVGMLATATHFATALFVWKLPAAFVVTPQASPQEQVQEALTAIRRRAVFIWQLPPLHLIQIREDRLLDQPVRRAVNGLRNALEAFTRSIVQLDPEGGCSHVGSYP